MPHGYSTVADPELELGQGVRDDNVSFQTGGDFQLNVLTKVPYFLGDLW